MIIRDKKNDFVSDEFKYRGYIVEYSSELDRDLVDVYNISADQLSVILIDGYMDKGIKAYQMPDLPLGKKFTAHLRLNGDRASFVIELDK